MKITPKERVKRVLFAGFLGVCMAASIPWVMWKLIVDDEGPDETIPRA